MVGECNATPPQDPDALTAREVSGTPGLNWPVIDDLRRTAADVRSVA